MSDDDKPVINSKIGMWRSVNKQVAENVPISPVKLFLHGLQELYSKTKDGMDAASMYWDVIKSEGGHLIWEGKISTDI